MKMVYSKYVTMMAFLIVTLIVHLNVSDISSIQYTSQSKFVYGNPLDFHLTRAYTPSDLVKYDGVHSIKEMEQDDNALSTYSRQSSDPRDSAVITMQRQGTANDTSAVYSLTIRGNGSVTYEGIKNVDMIGIQTYQIPIDKARELVSEFFNMYYGSLKDKYSDSSKGSSLQTVTTSITMEGYSKSVIDVHGANAPPELRALEDKIDEISNSKQWIKHP